ncbi:MAG: hypothetical protein J7507_12180 [Pseudoxanthomonas sp.]|nr:hypothetical protein [Pseudoxanthomonas sp.]
MKRDDVPAGAGETVVELDTGELVAVSCTREAAGARVRFHARARVLDTELATEYRHGALIAGLDADAIGLQCLLAVLGEPVTLPLAERVLAEVSIRSQISAAALAGEVDAGAVL